MGLTVVMVSVFMRGGSEPLDRGTNMLTTGTIAIFHSGFYRDAREIIVTIVRALGADYSDEAAFRVRAENGQVFSAFAWELTAL